MPILEILGYIAAAVVMFAMNVKNIRSELS